MGVLAIKRNVPIAEALLRTSCPYRFLETKLVARKPGSASAIAGFTRATTSPSIDRSAQAVLGCVADLLVRVEEASHLGYS